MNSLAIAIAVALIIIVALIVYFLIIKKQQPSAQAVAYCSIVRPIATLTYVPKVTYTQIRTITYEPTETQTHTITIIPPQPITTYVITNTQIRQPVVRYTCF